MLTMPVVNLLPLNTTMKEVRNENGDVIDIEFSNKRLQAEHEAMKLQKEEKDIERRTDSQRKAALFATRKAGKSLGHNSSSVFGGGGSTKEINEIGVTLG